MNELLEDDDIFGFIIMDGNGCLYATLQGNTRSILHKFTVDLPKKHGRGGQSALRFARLRMEKRHNYVRKCAEHAVTFFITDNKCNVTGLVLGGSADFKTELLQSDLFDPRLQKAVIKTVDVSYGMDPGFNQAIELAGECLANVKLVQEKKLLQKYFDEISQDTGKYCFMVQDTLQALEMSSVETIIVWENLTINRLTVKNTSTGEEQVLHLDPEQEKNDAHFHDPVTGVQLEIIERLTLVSIYFISFLYLLFSCSCSCLGLSVICLYLHMSVCMRLCLCIHEYIYACMRECVHECLSVSNVCLSVCTKEDKIANYCMSVSFFHLLWIILIFREIFRLLILS